eukprot:366029-Chlamydomonas_euryale.AAC.11
MRAPGARRHRRMLTLSTSRWLRHHGNSHARFSPALASCCWRTSVAGAAAVVLRFHRHQDGRVWGGGRHEIPAGCRSAQLWVAAAGARTMLRQENGREHTNNVLRKLAP